MPNETAHIELALRNQLAIDYLVKELDAHPEWVTTVAFYKAVHVVEAMFARDRNVEHGRSHGVRNRILKDTPKYDPIWRVYRPLFAASTVARYMEDATTGAQHTVFADYMPPARVASEVLGHLLHQVQLRSRPHLSSTSVATLGLPSHPKKKGKRGKRKK